MKENVLSKFEELKTSHNDKIIELNKVYWVSEWSWNPICDGYAPCEETIRYVQNIDGINIYTTGTSYRYYYAWDICETKEECYKITDIKNDFAYDWCSVDHLIPEDRIINILK
ncbi:hypothetical protein [Terrisporobacter sp.]|uniref:hypothetical protein n=1 Tax=Terrisporobacter sp. TaxID=1965305 RepID=UPI00289E3C68|nr:hypothetical protein [Terrisporobacter sp.]